MTLDTSETSEMSGISERGLDADGVLAGSSGDREVEVDMEERDDNDDNDDSDELYGIERGANCIASCLSRIRRFLSRIARNLAY